MRALIEKKRERAKDVSFHASVPVGTTDLRQLFIDREYDQILAFLKAGRFGGQLLTTPGNAQGSYFFGLLDSMGFSDEEKATVKEWINSL